MNLIPMQFEDADIRVIEENGEPWFVGKDVAEALGYSNPQKAVRDHCKSPKPVGQMRVNESFTLDRQTVIIAESDVFRLIVSSKLPAAERFERWVFERVLPAIRKTGGYGNPADLSKMDVLKMAIESESERERLALVVEEQAPKVVALERFANHDGQHNIRNSAKLLGVRERLFIAWMIGHEWLYRDHAGRLCAKSPKIRAGYLDTMPVEIKRTAGVETVPQPVITQKGLAKLAVLLAKDGLIPKHDEAA